MLTQYRAGGGARPLRPPPVHWPRECADDQALLSSPTSTARTCATASSSTRFPSTASTWPCSSVTSPARSSCRSSRRATDAWECTLMGQHRDIDAKEELADIKKTIENAGYYWVHQTREEFDDTRSDPAKIDALFKSLVVRARAGVARPRRRASRGQAVPDVHGAGQRRLVRHRRHDRQRQARAPVRQARRRDRQSRDDHLVGAPTPRRGTRRAR